MDSDVEEYTKTMTPEDKVAFFKKPSEKFVEELSDHDKEWLKEYENLTPEAREK